MNSDLDIAFNKAYQKASNTQLNLPPDIMLKLYAYYKQAVKGDLSYSFDTDQNVRSAFKLNAWMQLKGMTEKEAKQEYINLVNKFLK